MLSLQKHAGNRIDLLNSVLRKQTVLHSTDVLSTYCMPGTGSGAGDASVNKEKHKNVCPHRMWWVPEQGMMDGLYYLVVLHISYVHNLN